MKLLQRPLNRYNSLNQGKKDILVLLTVAVSLIIMAQFLTLHRMSDFLVYCMLVLGLDFLYGYMGQLTFGIMLYFGTGTYAATIFWARVSPNPLLGIAVGVAAGVLVSLVVGALTIRLRGPIFALANMGFNQVGFFIAAYPFPHITGGEDGMPVRVGKLGEILITRQPTLFILVLVSTLLVFFLLRKLTTSPFGIMARSMPQGEQRVRHMGYNLHYYRLMVYVIAMSIASFAGTINAINYGFISPAYIDPARNVEVIFATLIGGRGNLVGALVGGMVYMTMSNYIASYILRWETVLGVLLILTAFRFRTGIVGFIQVKLQKIMDQEDHVQEKSQAGVVKSK
jgi:branched-chain amino acid transport system permease protein